MPTISYNQGQVSALWQDWMLYTPRVFRHVYLDKRCRSFISEQSHIQPHEDEIPQDDFKHMMVVGLANEHTLLSITCNFHRKLNTTLCYSDSISTHNRSFKTAITKRSINFPDIHQVGYKAIGITEDRHQRDHSVFSVVRPSWKLAHRWLLWYTKRSEGFIQKLKITSPKHQSLVAHMYMWMNWINSLMAHTMNQVAIN